MNAASGERLEVSIDPPHEVVVNPARLVATLGGTTVDQLGVVVCVAEATGKLRFANRAANALFARRGDLRCEGGHLCSPHPEVVATLMRALEGATRSPGTASAFSPRPSVAPAERLQVRVAPLPEDSVLARHGTGPLAMVLVAVGIPPRSEEELRALFGFTPSEAALARLLASGLAPVEIAEIRAVSLATVRTQLASLFAKTGTHSQAQFVGLVTALPGAFGEQAP